MLLQITLTFLLTLAFVVATPPPGYQKKEEATSDKNVPKYKYGYKISDEKGSQEKQEQRDGIYAHGRYNVHGQNSHQTVEYLADDWGFHPFIEYSNMSPHSKSSTIIALGEEAVKALRNNQKTTPSFNPETSDQPGTQQSNVVYVTQPQFQTTQQVYINNELPTTPTQQSVSFTVSPTQQVTHLPNQQQNLIFVTNPAHGLATVDTDSNNQQNSHSIKINHPLAKNGKDIGEQKDEEVKNNVVYTTPQAITQNENVVFVPQTQENVVYINHPHPTQKLVIADQQNLNQLADQQQHNQQVLINQDEQDGKLINQPNSQSHQNVLIEQHENRVVHSNQNQLKHHLQPAISINQHQNAVLQDTHANLALADHGGNQIYQHTSAQLVQVNHDGENKHQSEADKLFQGVAQLENQVAQFAQKVAQQQTTGEQQLINHQIAGEISHHENKVVHVTQGYRDAQQTNHYTEQANAQNDNENKIAHQTSQAQNLYIDQSNNHEDQTDHHRATIQSQHHDAQQAQNNQKHHIQHENKIIDITQTHEDKEKISQVNQAQNHYVDQTNTKNQASNENNLSHHHAQQISQAYKIKTINDYSQQNSNEEDLYPYSGAYGTKINPKFNHHVEQNYHSSKLIENTKNLISGQDVLNINDVLNQNLGEHAEVTTTANDDNLVSTTLIPKLVASEKNEISLLKEPIVVAELDENNINGEEKESYFSTTRSTLETVNTASDFQSTQTVVVTPRPVGTTFLAPITAGVQLEQAGEVKEEKPKVKTSVLVDIQKSVPYYIGRFEYVRGPNGYVSKQVDKEANSTTQTEEFGQQLLQYTLEAIPTPEGLIQQTKTKVSPTVQGAVPHESTSQALDDHQTTAKAFSEYQAIEQALNQQTFEQDTTQQQAIEQALAQHQKYNQAINEALIQHQSAEQQKQSSQTENLPTPQAFIQHKIHTQALEQHDSSQKQQQQLEIAQKTHQQQFESSLVPSHHHQQQFEASLEKLQQQAVNTAFEQQQQFEASLAKSQQQAINTAFEQQKQFEASLAKSQQHALEQDLTTLQQQTYQTSSTPQILIQQQLPTPQTLVHPQILTQEHEPHILVQQEVLTTPQIYIQQLPQLLQQPQVLVQHQDAESKVVNKPPFLVQAQKGSEDKNQNYQQILIQKGQQEDKNQAQKEEEQQIITKNKKQNQQPQQHHLRQILLQNHQQAQQEQQKHQILIQQEYSASQLQAENQILLIPTPQTSPQQDSNQYLIEPLPTPLASTQHNHKQFLIEPLPTPQSLIQQKTSEENKVQNIHDQKTEQGQVDYQVQKLIPQHGKQQGNLISQYSQNIVHTQTGQKQNSKHLHGNGHGGVGGQGQAVSFQSFQSQISNVEATHQQSHAANSQNTYVQAVDLKSQREGENVHRETGNTHAQDVNKITAIRGQGQIHPNYQSHSQASNIQINTANAHNSHNQLANAYAQAVNQQHQIEAENNHNQAYTLNFQGQIEAVNAQAANFQNKVESANQQATQASNSHAQKQSNVKQEQVIHHQNNEQIQEDQNIINEFYQHLQQLTPHLANDEKKSDVKYQLPIPQHIYLVPPQIQEINYPQDLVHVTLPSFNSQKLAAVTQNGKHQQFGNQQEIQNSFKNHQQKAQNQIRHQQEVHNQIRHQQEIQNQQDMQESIRNQNVQKSIQNQIRHQQEVRNHQQEVQDIRNQQKNQNPIRGQYEAQNQRNVDTPNTNYQYAHNAIKAAQTIHNNIRNHQEYIRNQQEQQLAASNLKTHEQNFEAQKLQQKQEAQDLQIESSQEVQSNVQNIHAEKERVVEIVKSYPVKVPYPVEKIVRQPYPVEVKVPVEVPVDKIVEKKVPVPVEVNVPVPQPFVVEVPKPYPVQVTKLVPQPYPVTVTQTVKVPVPTPVEVKVPHPVPVEVPKYIDRPYPIYVSKETQQKLGTHLYAPNYQINCDHKEESYVPTGSNFYHTIHLNDYIGLTPPKSTNKPTSAYQTISASHNVPTYHQPSKQLHQKQNTKPQPQAHPSPYVTYTISQQNQHQTTTKSPHSQNVNHNYNYARKYRNARQSFENLRIEYGFMPPLIPSLEIDENGNPVEKPDDS